MTQPTTQPPFTRDLLGRVVDTLRHVYEVNRDHTDTELGHDETSHGVLLYKSITHFLPGNVAGLRRVRSEIQNGSLLVREGDYALRCFRIGYTEFDDPWTSFPHNRGAAPAMAASNAEQLRLFDNLGGAGEPEGLEYIVGDCGNWLGGLRAVHLCLPLGRADERVRQWLALETIYRADEDEALDRWPIVTPEPPITPTPEPVVRLRPSRREASNDRER